MVSFFGDYDTSETVHIPFNTFSSDDPSASVTITSLAAADVEIHKDGGTTQRASDNGVTVSIDFDSITGNHLVGIDLSDNSDAGFYSAGSRYQVRIEGTTVDGATINAWIGAFSIGCTLRPATDGRALAVDGNGRVDVSLIEGSDATDQINAACDTAMTDYNAATVTQLNNRTLPAADYFDVTSDQVTVSNNNDKTGYRLSSTGVDDVLDEVVEGTLTLRQITRIVLSVLAGKSTGGGTSTINFRDEGDSKNRVTATVDPNQNRTGISLDGA